MLRMGKGELAMKQKKIRWVTGICLLGCMISCSGCEASFSQAPSFALPETEATGSSQQMQTNVEFPHTLSGRGLVMEALISYDGPFWEDGSGDTVERVAGLQLYNPSERMVEFMAVVVECGGKRLYFFVYQLPPDSRCLVLEKSRNTYQDLPVAECRELSIRWDYQDLSRIQLDYLGLGPWMTVINRDARRQDHITLWYKRYEPEGDYYLGGIAYSEHVFFLQPQERRTIAPKYYEAGSTKIVAIQLDIV